MFEQYIPTMLATVNQTDRIQGMALYMNTEGAQVDWFSLTMIAGGMLLIVLVLQLFAERAERKRKEAFEALQARRKAKAGLVQTSYKGGYRRLNRESKVSI